MRKVHWEIVASAVFVLGGAFLVYGQLENNAAFWDAQSIWSVVLIVGWTVVAVEYYRQGWNIHHARTSANVSVLMPLTYFVMQCILFVKGVFFSDWSLIACALILNSGIVFYLYQIIKLKRRWAQTK